MVLLSFWAQIHAASARQPKSCAPLRWHSPVTSPVSLHSLSAISGQAHFEALFALPEHTWAPSDSLRLQTFTTVITTENLDQCFSQKPNNILREKDVDLERA